MRKKKEYAHFAEAIQNGRAKQQLQVADRLVQDALDGSFPDKAFYLERFCGWTKPVDSERPSESIRHSGLSSDLVAVLRESLLANSSSHTKPNQSSTSAP